MIFLLLGRDLNGNVLNPELMFPPAGSADYLMYLNRVVTKILLENGADINAKNADGSTPLMYAASKNENPKIAITLIKAGASLKEKNDNGKTALYYLKKRDDWPVIKKAMQEAGIKFR